MFAPYKSYKWYSLHGPDLQNRPMQKVPGSGSAGQVGVSGGILKALGRRIHCGELAL